MSDIIADANSEKVDRHVMAPAALKTSGGDLKKVSIPPTAASPRSSFSASRAAALVRWKTSSPSAST